MLSANSKAVRVARATAFSTAFSEDVVVARIEEELSRLPVQVKHSNDYKLRIASSQPGGIMTCKIEVLTVAPQLNVVEMKRGRGSILDFHWLYKQLRIGLRDISPFGEKDRALMRLMEQSEERKEILEHNNHAMRCVGEVREVREVKDVKDMKAMSVTLNEREMGVDEKVNKNVSGDEEKVEEKDEEKNEEKLKVSEGECGRGIGDEKREETICGDKNNVCKEITSKCEDDRKSTQENTQEREQSDERQISSDIKTEVSITTSPQSSSSSAAGNTSNESNIITDTRPLTQLPLHLPPSLPFPSHSVCSQQPSSCDILPTVSLSSSSSSSSSNSSSSSSSSSIHSQSPSPAPLLSTTPLLSTRLNRSNHRSSRKA